MADNIISRDEPQPENFLTRYAHTLIALYIALLEDDNYTVGRCRELIDAMSQEFRDNYQLRDIRVRFEKVEGVDGV